LRPYNAGMRGIAMLIDLHMHTTASDGEYPVATVIEMAHARGITTLAITDHDTTDAITEAQALAAPLGMTVIAGIELSAETEEDGDVHMLGYYVDVHDSAFQARLKDFRTNRYHRGRAMVEKLHTLGVNIPWEAVEQAADGAPITRPHIAKALVQGGYVSTMQAAFDTYLDDDAPAYVARQRMSPEEAIDLIHSAGGVAVVAHAGLIKRYAPVIERLIPYGLNGVEVNHPKNSATVQAWLQAIATQHKLIVTGGSDFHRPESDGTITLGQYPAPVGVIEALQASRKFS